MDTDLVKSLMAALQVSRKLAYAVALLLERECVTENNLREQGVHTDIWLVANRLRRKLSTHGIELRSLHGTGYWISDDDKSRVRAMAKELM